MKHPGSGSFMIGLDYAKKNGCVWEASFRSCKYRPTPLALLQIRSSPPMFTREQAKRIASIPASDDIQAMAVRLGE